MILCIIHSWGSYVEPCHTEVFFRQCFKMNPFNMTPPFLPPSLRNYFSLSVVLCTSHKGDHKRWQVIIRRIYHLMTNNTKYNRPPIDKRSTKIVWNYRHEITSPAQSLTHYTSQHKAKIKASPQPLFLHRHVLTLRAGVAVACRRCVLGSCTTN